ncbi:MAG TPA: 3'-5' exonuclease [Muribaculum sp.]|jgi:ribonuclease D|uniref:3'-5' exonuclease n=1 Tax=Heminiphilus faecis TaxID=2601703 RepID=A0ABV4CWV4_9BACT|nr:3'-5' exonuclease [Heminiphilus faecis]RLT76559.1 3'-5' exonuclease domain-containing protein 2 [bacterium J10(2018)]HRF69023.1 3'-5' exonuclease [Muribaculum sp.]
MNVNTLVLSITKEQLSALPTVTYPGHIIVINTVEQAKSALETIRRFPVVGFDTETKPSFRKGRTNQVALMQFATEECCYLFRINKFGFPDELRDLIENPRITKVGLSLKDDFHVMHKLHDFQPAGFVDLQDLVKEFNILDCSLQKIYGIIFGERISKSQRLSNWEASTLSTPQQTYASIDAWACLKIYSHLTAGRFDPCRSPYIKHVDESNDTNR